MTLTTEWIFGSLAFALLAGFVGLVWGRALPRCGDWLCGLALVGLFLGILLNQPALFNGSVGSETWIRGWIWPKGEVGSILIGLLSDPMGLAMSTAAVMIALFAIMNRRMVSTEARAERFYVAATLGAAGTMLSWMSLTPWLSFMGIGFANLAGFIALGARWDEAAPAERAARFSRERSIGLLVAMTGVFALLSSGAGLDWSTPLSWPSGRGIELGAGLLLLGIMVQFQPFPFLGWIVLKDDSLIVERVVFSQVFPGLAAFALLVRLDAPLRASGAYVLMGWFSLASCILAIGTGLFQKGWKVGLSAWVSASFAAAAAAAAFAGARVGLVMFLGFSLAAISIAMAGATLEKASTGGLKAAVFFAAILGGGGLGSVVCGGGVRWLQAGLTDTGSSATGMIFAFALFWLNLLLWKQAWMLTERGSSGKANWIGVALPFVPLVIGLGVLWTGALSGGALFGDPDRVMVSAVDKFFGTTGAATGDETTFITASWVYWGVLVLSWIFAYWMSSESGSRWQALQTSFPGMSRFFGGAYGVDVATKKGLSGLSWGSRQAEKYVTEKIWKEWVPQGAQRGGHRVSVAVVAADDFLWSCFCRTLRRGVDVASKLLQLIQNGDVQWYLFFAVTMGIAVLARFLNFS